MLKRNTGAGLWALGGAAAVLALGTIPSADAGTATANLAVTASVSANCSITTTALAFGPYDPIVANATAPLDGQGSVTIACTNGSAATVYLGQGLNPATGSTDTVPLRRLVDGGSDFINYHLYSDNGYSTVWQGPTGTGVSETGTGLTQTVTVYGQIPAGQTTAPAASYSDTVVATVSF
jgi:spore coat protein U-like protein